MIMLRLLCKVETQPELGVTSNDSLCSGMVNEKLCTNRDMPFQFLLSKVYGRGCVYLDSTPILARCSMRHVVVLQMQVDPRSSKLSSELVSSWLENWCYGPKPACYQIFLRSNDPRRCVQYVPSWLRMKDIIASDKRKVKLAP